jgi:hypothetical protein
LRFTKLVQIKATASKDLVNQVSEDYHSTSSNSNSWDKFDEAILAGHFALEVVEEF